MYTDVLDEFEEGIDAMLGTKFEDHASFKVSIVLHDRLKMITENFEQADFLFSNIRVEISEDMYEDNEKQINDLAEKMAQIMVNMYHAFVVHFGETAAKARIVKSDLHFTLET